MSARSSDLPGKSGNLLRRLRQAETVLLPLTTAALVLGTSQIRRYALGAIYVGKFAMMGLLGGVALLIVVLERHRPRVTAFAAGFALLVLFAFASTLYSVARRSTLEHSISLLILAVTVLAVPLTWRTRGDVIQALRSIALVAAAAAIAGLLLAPTSIIVAFDHRRFLGIFENPNALGYLVAPILPALLVASLRAVSANERRIVLAIGGVIAFGLLLTGSRAGILASLVGITAGGLAVGGQTRRILTAVATVALFGGLLTFVPGSPFQHNSGYGEAVDLLSGGGRTDAWAAAIRLTGERPVAGHGFGTTETFFLDRSPELRLKYGRTYGAPHNSYFETALELGWPGMVLLVLLVCSGILAAVRVVRRHDAWQPLGPVALAGIVGGTVEGFFESSVLAVGGLLAFHFWLMVSLAHTIRSDEEAMEVAPLVTGEEELHPDGLAGSLRILFVSRAYYPAVRYGGPVASLRRTCEELVARGHTVTVYCSNMATPGVMGRRLQPGRFLIGGVRVRFLDTPVRFHWEGLGWEGVADLRRQVGQSDIVYISGTRHYLAIMAERAARRRGVPYLVAPDGSLPARSRTIFGKQALDAAYTRRSVTKAAGVLATSETEASDLQSWGVSPDRLRIVPPFVKAVPLSERSKDELRSTRDLPLAAPVVLWIGRMHPEKALPSLFDAMNDPRLLHVHLILAGGSEDRTLAQELQRRAAREPLAGRVHFMPWVDDREKADLFKLADLFVLPSRKENFGMAAAEAVVSGLPAVVTEGCGVAPLFAGRAGVVCGHEPSDIAGALHAVLSDEDELKRLRAGTAAVAEDLDGHRMIDRLEAICWDLTEARVAPAATMVEVDS